MADQLNTTKTETQANEASEAAKKAIAAAADTAAPVAATPAPAAAKPVAAKVAPTKPVSAKPVRKARVGQAPAKVVEAVKKTNARAKAAARRAPRKTVIKAAPIAAENPIERTTTMTYDFTKLFVTPELPGVVKFQEMFGEAGTRGQEMVTKSRVAAEEMAEIAKANMEAFAEAGRIAATGARTLGQDMLASGREGLEQASASVRTLADAKSPTEFLQIQAELARTSFDRAVAEGSKFAEAMVKLAGEAVQPLSTRATLNAERINELAA